VPIAGQAYSYVCVLVSQGTPNTFQVNPTLAVGDVTVSTNFGAPANIASLPTVLSASALVRVNLAAGEVGDQTSVFFHDVAGDEWADAHTPLQSAVGIVTAAVDITQGAADKVFGASGAALPELAQAIPAATPSPQAAMMLLYMALRNLDQVTATEKRITNDAGTVIAKKALTDDGATYTEAEMVSGP